MPPPLYRGVPRNTARGREALIRRTVLPRGTSTDYAGHVRGEPVQADVTSWTYDEQVARRFGDLILVIDEDDVRARVVTPHPLPNRYPQEREVLIRGPVKGFQTL
jgi:hypothetical protein